MEWPLEQVKLFDTCLSLVDEWEGYLVPRYLPGVPNEDSRAPFWLEFGCGFRIALKAGNLEDVIWEVLMVHDSWCMSRSAR